MEKIKCFGFDMDYTLAGEYLLNFFCHRLSLEYCFLLSKDQLLVGLLQLAGASSISKYIVPYLLHFHVRCFLLIFYLQAVFGHKQCCCSTVSSDYECQGSQSLISLLASLDSTIF